MKQITQIFSSITIITIVTFLTLSGCAIEEPVSFTTETGPEVEDNNHVGSDNLLSSVTKKRISAGDAHTCFVDVDGKVWCWGDNQDGQSSMPTDIEVASIIGAGK